MVSTEVKLDVLAGYRSLTRKLGKSITANKLSNFERLVTGYQPLRDAAFLNQKATADEYNVFSVLKLHRLEAKFHTPLIADLLNPNRKHAQSADNYISFVTHVLQEHDDSKWAKVTPFLLNVKAEAHTPVTGRIDILITHNDPANRFCVIIENKIGAADQRDQVWRYYRYAIDMLRLTDDQIKILYLCPEQTIPSDYSVKAEQVAALTSKDVLKCVSYRSHISGWITACRDSTIAPPVKEVLSQYLQTLKLLCP
jgi:hypothetical protein